MKAIIIAGPTASGKSDFALTIARFVGGQIINADSAQMYQALAIGTAKPDWRSSDIEHHLFDSIAEPVNYDVVAYQEHVGALITSISAQRQLPILVGGSLFYIKSLFYPPHSPLVIGSMPDEIRALRNHKLWEHLYDLDEKRALQINPNDEYRVLNAIEKWYVHGIRPSELAPRYNPSFSAHILFLSPPLDELYERINKRTIIMIREMGWIAEAEALCGRPAWKAFIEAKNFIGYPELFEWIARGKKEAELDRIIERIQQETRHYAKRQRTFWRSFLEQLARDRGSSSLACEITQITDLAEFDIKTLRSFYC